MAEREIDPVTGIETTGHEWDGIKELNTPLPKWWLYSFYATIVWAIGYFVLYPAWPSLSGYTEGMLGYSSRAELAATMDQVKQSRVGWLTKFEEKSVDEIAEDQELLQYAMAGGRAIFGENCAPCHGAGGAGAPGYPVLADDDWIWGGTPEEIYTSVQYGIRSAHEDTREAMMLAFGADEILEAPQIKSVANHVMSLAGAGQSTAEGALIFEEQCSACHGEDGKGLREMGGPNLTDGIWLYGEGVEALTAQIAAPKHGVMPAWVDRIDDVSIKQVSIYVHSLGGGEK
ncbi:MAG: cytochrome-c oxidase, cbb3-type subunit III [Rhodospirillales bacterium]|jgi:cytochrome c oxidase cbb3-type subunit III|nr:cytochrome-c oxidase, cbb3-type subunit III [Rhodospirillales bacterium]